MRYEKDGKIIDIPDAEVRLAKRMLGMPEDRPDPLPEKFCALYLEMQSFVRRVGVTRVGIEGLALLCILAKQTAPPDNKHKWLLDAITSKAIKAGDKINVEFRNAIVEGKYQTADVQKEIVVVEVDGQERKLPFAAVKQKVEK